MNPFKNLKTRVEEYSKKFPNEIHVYISLLKQNAIIKEDSLFYRFLFSEKGKKRDLPLLRKEILNTKDLYQKIISEYLASGYFISLAFTETKKDVNYTGIVVENHLHQKLKIYFSEVVLCKYMKEYLHILNILENKKEKDFYQYCKQLIQEKAIRRLVFIKSMDKKSSIIYTDDYYNDHRILKQNNLEYFYIKEENKIPLNEIYIILNLIVTCINENKEQNPTYIYETNHKYQTTGLKITFNKELEIVVKDSDLIDIIESVGIIDQLWKMQHQKLNYLENTNKDQIQRRLIKNKH